MLNRLVNHIVSLNTHHQRGCQLGTEKVEKIAITINLVTLTSELLIYRSSSTLFKLPVLVTVHHSMQTRWNNRLSPFTIKQSLFEIKSHGAANREGRGLAHCNAYYFLDDLPPGGQKSQSSFFFLTFKTAKNQSKSTRLTPPVDQCYA